MMNRGTPGTGRQSAYRNPYNSGGQGAQQRTYGGSPYAVQSATGGMETVANPEQRWSLQHREFQPQQQQPQQQQPQQQQQRARAASQTSVNYQGQQAQQPRVSMSMSSQQQGAGGGLPPELEGNPNVNYVKMNWEDILGGKDGLSGLKVSMAPAAPGSQNQNRQIRIGLGDQAGNNDGSTPLKILSWQPIENYPGQMTSGSTASVGQQQQQQSGGGPRISVGSPVMMPSQAVGNTYGRQTRPLVGGAGVSQPGPGYSYATTASQGGQPQQARSQTPAQRAQQAPNCGNCSACQFKQPYGNNQRRR